MSTNLFIARTPLQLLNCLEACKTRHASQRNCLLFMYARDVDRDMMRDMVDAQTWSEVFEYPLNPFRRLLFPLYTDGIVRRIGKVNSCYYGAYNSIVSRIINGVDPETLYVVDDGVKTFEIARKVAEGAIHDKGRLKALRDRLLRSDIRYLYRSNFYTIYDLDAYGLQARVVRNGYEHLRGELGAKETDGEVWFVGTNLLERIMTDAAAFERMLEQVLERYEGRKFRYVLHRYEAMDYMRSLAERYGFECVRFEHLIEIELVRAPKLPSEIASFGSSAIDTLSTIFDKANLRVFRLAPESIVEDRREVFERLYAEFELKGIAVERL